MHGTTIKSKNIFSSPSENVFEEHTGKEKSGFHITLLERMEIIESKKKRKRVFITFSFLEGHF